MKRRLLAPVFVMAFAALASAGGAPPSSPPWQQAVFNVNPTQEPLASLDLMVDLDPTTKWPRISRHMTACTARHADPAIHEPDAADSYRPIFLGTMRAGAGGAKLTESGRTWARSQLSVASTQPADGEASVTVSASRLSPGILISGGKRLALFAGPGAGGSELTGDALPAWFAVPNGDSVAIRPAAEVGQLPLAGLDRSWMLVWYGQKSFFKGLTTSLYTEKTIAKELYPADSPMLLMFDRSPASLRAVPGEGMTIDFGEQPGRVVLLPILGQQLPRAAETEKWKDGLPPAITERCQWWSAHMSRFPTGAVETYHYDAAGDTVTIAERISFEPFRQFGSFAAPVPPIIGTASIEGFPVEFSPKAYDIRHVTSLGSFLAIPDVDSYEIRFKGLRRYVDARPVVSGQDTNAWKIELVDQVRRILDAGHLAPWFRVRKICDGWVGNFFPQTANLVHANPGEILYFLAEALPLLPADLQDRARAYMRRERAEYPPEKISFLLGGQGARRESYPLTESFLADVPQDKNFNNINYSRGTNFFVSHKLIPPISIYYLASYYAAAGGGDLAQAWPDIQAIADPYLKQMDWASGSAHRWPGLYSPYKYQRWTTLRTIDYWHGAGGVVDASQAFAAAVGQIRLARMAKDSAAEELGWGLLARNAALRYALGRMPGYFYRQGLLSVAPGQKSIEQDIRVPFFLDQYGVSVRLWIYDDNGLTMLHDMTPELGLFMKDHLAPETHRYYDQFTDRLPTWHLAWSEQTLDGESNRLIPQDVYETFMAHAWVFDSPADWLNKHLDLPWQPRGDLYYLGKLIETARVAARR